MKALIAIGSFNLIAGAIVLATPWHAVGKLLRF